MAAAAVLENTAIILIRPRIPENIGACCRAMMNMGLRRLVVVAPENFDRDRIYKTATHVAVAVADAIEVCDSLEAALPSFTYIAGTTARRGKQRQMVLPPEQLARKVVSLAADNSMAIVFGPEDRGLENDELRYCHNLITIPTATDQMLPHGIGLITLSQFSQDAASAFQSALNRLKPYHPRAYILDMRNNPGGYVDQAVGIAQDIIPKGKVATLVGKNYPAQVYSSQSGKSLGVPLVVLVNGGTASAAEILSAAIVQNHEGRLMGTQTFGKGIAQQVMPMQQGGYLKITIAQWMTPNGSNIEHKGITPTYIVTGTQAPLVAAQASLGGTPSMKATLKVGSLWLTADGQQDALGHAPAMKGGQLYLSTTAVEQATGALVNYQTSAKTFEVVLGKDTLTLTVGQGQGSLDGRSVKLAPAEVMSGAPMIPVQDLVQAFRVKSQSLGGGSYRLTTTY